MWNRERFFEFIMVTLTSQALKYTQGQVYRVLWELHMHGLLFHLDDDPFELPMPVGCGKLFSGREAAILKLCVPYFFGGEVLPDYDGDAHRICVELTNNSPENPRTLPRWGFSFDEEPENHYTAFTEPRRWNGWACPLLPYEVLNQLLLEQEYKYSTVRFIAKDGHPAAHLSFVIRSIQGTDLLADEYIVIDGEIVRDREGVQHLCYPTSQLGLCFNIDDCQELNVENWVGYF